MTRSGSNSDMAESVYNALAPVVWLAGLVLLAVQISLAIGEDPRYDPPTPPATVVAYNGESAFLPPLSTPAGGVTPAPLLKETAP